MYKKNISLALLETTFRLPTGSASDEADGLSPRVAQIGHFLDQYFERLSAFDDVKSYVAELSFDEATSLLDEVIPKMAGEVGSVPPHVHLCAITNCTEKDGDKARKIVLSTLEYRLRYLLSTCPQTLSSQTPVEGDQPQEQPLQCRMCTEVASIPCVACLKKLVVDAAAAYKQITGDKELLGAIPRLDKDPRLDLALVLGMSLLKLSGLKSRTSDTNHSLWESVDLGLFLQAVLVLDTQLKDTPEDIQLRLLLVQLYLLVGCASYAYQLWTPLEVKRTIQDALSPLFFDRISDISPGLFQGPRPLMEPLRSYYNHNLGARSPVRIWDAFSAGSYTSIFDMTNYDHDLRRSCTLMMTLVEERRAIRCYGGKIDSEIDQHPLTGKFSWPSLGGAGH